MSALLPTSYLRALSRPVDTGGFLLPDRETVLQQWWGVAINGRLANDSSPTSESGYGEWRDIPYVREDGKK